MAVIRSNIVDLCTGQTGNGDSTNTAQRSRLIGSPGAVVINSTAGTTVTVAILGSCDGTNWFNVPYALVATPTTYVVTAITITTTTVTTYLLQANQPWAFVKLNLSANTGMTITAVASL